jgi:integrase
VYFPPDKKTWVGMLDLGWEGGKRRRRTVYGKTGRAVLEKARRAAPGPAARGEPRGPPADGRRVARRVAERGQGARRDSAGDAGAYRFIAERYITPAIGWVLLDQLKPADVQRLVASARTSISEAGRNKGRPPSPSTLRHVHGVLRNALNDAERLELVARNAARAVKAPPLPNEERRAVTPDDARRFFAVIADDRLEALFVVALTTGLRRGEILGLRWEDVDLAAGVVTVRRSVQRLGGQLRAG